MVDHVERIADTDLLAVLLKAKEITGGNTIPSYMCIYQTSICTSEDDLAGANIGLILISSVAWGSCLFECDTMKVVRPAQLLFPAYEEELLTKVRLSILHVGLRFCCKRQRFCCHY